MFLSSPKRIECLVSDSKVYDDALELERWGMRIASSLPVFPGPRCPGVVIPITVPSTG